MLHENSNHYEFFSQNKIEYHIIQSNKYGIQQYNLAVDKNYIKGHQDHFIYTVKLKIHAAVEALSYREYAPTLCIIV